MAHVGEELRLHGGRLERLVARGGELEDGLGALDEEADRQPDRGQQLAQLLVGLVELAAVELDRAEAVLAGADRQADGAGEPRGGDRDRAVGGGARHQRLGPHRVAGVGHAHRQVLERERRGARRGQLALERAVAPGRGGLQLAALVVGQPQRADLPAEVAAERLEQQRRRLLDGRRLREHARRVVAGAQQLLAAGLLGDVLELDEELGGPALGVGQGGRVDEHPARLAAVREQPALRLVRADLAGQHALEQPLARRPLLGVDGVGERQPEQLLLAAAGQVAERGVDLAEAPVGADHRHPGRRVLERADEALLRLAQRGLGVLALGDVGGDAADAVGLAGLVGERELDRAVDDALAAQLEPLLELDRLAGRDHRLLEGAQALRGDAEALGRLVVEEEAPLEVPRVDRRGAVVHQAAEAVVGALEVGLGLPARLDVGAHLDLGHHRLREVLEDRDLLGLPGARRVAGDAQRPEHVAAGQPQRDAGVGEHLAGLDDREALGQLVLARVVDDQRLRRRRRRAGRTCP